MFFFFKQKTAYEMRISDWSSDVCSSDLRASMLKRLTKSGPGLRAAGLLAGLVIRLVRSTTRWERVVDPGAAALLEGPAPLIGAFWHNRTMLISASSPRPRPLDRKSTRLNATH